MTPSHQVPSRCAVCGSPTMVHGMTAWCETHGPVRFGAWQSTQHPRGKHGQFGTGNAPAHAQAPTGATANAAITDKAVRAALAFFSAAEQAKLPRIALALKRPEGVDPRAEGYHVTGYPAIYIATWSQVYGEAERGNLQAAMKLAGILAHEAAHVTTGDEGTAYQAEIDKLNAIGAPQGMVDDVRRAAATVARGKK